MDELSSFSSDRANLQSAVMCRSRAYPHNTSQTTVFHVLETGAWQKIDRRVRCCYSSSLASSALNSGSASPSQHRPHVKLASLRAFNYIPIRDEMLVEPIEL